MMTSSGFEILARTLKETMPVKSYYPEAYNQWERDIMAICRGLREDNPNFNVRTFLVACGAET